MPEYGKFTGSTVTLSTEDVVRLASSLPSERIAHARSTIEETARILADTRIVPVLPGRGVTAGSVAIGADPNMWQLDPVQPTPFDARRIAGTVLAKELVDYVGLTDVEYKRHDIAKRAERAFLHWLAGLDEADIDRLASLPDPLLLSALAEIILKGSTTTGERAQPTTTVESLWSKVRAWEELQKGAAVQAVQDAQPSPTETAPDPLAEAKRRAREHQDWILENVPMLGAGEAAKLLRVTRQALDKRRKKLAVLGVQWGRNWYYPKDQFGIDDVVPGLEEVLATLPFESDWPRLDWMLKEREEFQGRNAFTALKQDDIDLVIAEASDFGDM